jgi:hexosaminidase
MVFSVNCWQELLLNYNASVLNFPKDTMITAWTSPDRLVPIVRAGYPALLSGGWYLTAEGLHWNDYYKNEPFDIANFTESEKDLIKGGEACMWGERIDDTDFDVRVFPRIFSVAEKLWSSYDVRIIDGITEDRISHHRCNFVRRGVAAGPVAPDYCSAVYMYKKFSWQK